MNKFVKIASITAVALAILIVAGFIFVYSSLDSIVKAAVESIASDMTQTEVTLNDVEISPTTGQGSLRGFTMSNPDGFKSNEAFQFDEISVKIDIKSLTDDVIIINEVRINAPHITYEVGPQKSNIDTINENTQSHGKSSETTASNEDAPKFIVEHLYLNDGEISVAAAPLGDKTIDVDLPNIHLKDIGKGDQGASPAVILQAAFGAVTKNITGALGSVDLDGLAKGVTDGVKGVADGVVSGASGVTSTVGDAASGATDGIKGAADGAGNALKGLLGD
ncbi:AsmA family protein [Kiloniella antarctica]|uniref:AsmA family protein n=1 Tax=Kiloniella antarctica TaxID=1550907 RepID=A0ABW5BLV9_9PROT